MASWKPGDRVMLRGDRWTVLETAPYGDCETIRLASSRAAHIRTFVLPFDRPRRHEGETTRFRVVRPRRALHHLRRAAVRVHPFGGLVTAAASAIDLLPYQLAPALAVLRHGWSRVLIADDPGLGKTIQAGLVAAELRARSGSARVLILAPAGLRAQWAAEMSAHFGLDVTLADAAWLRRAGTDLPAGTNPWTLPEVYLASHDFVKRAEVLRPLEDVIWDLLIVDEAHGVTIGTDRRSAVDALACRSRRVVLLTATPHDSDALQQAALGRIGASQSDAPWIAFRRTRRMVAPGLERRSRIAPVRPSDAERRMHRLLEDYTCRVWREATVRGDANARLASIILRKRALSSAASLALSVRRRLDLLADPPDADALQMPLPLGDEDWLEDAEPIAALAAPGLGNTRRELRWLSAILETASHAARHETKLHRLVALLRRVHEPLIVFTEYRDTLTRLRDGLASHGVQATVLHGGMSPAERTAAQREFNTSAQLLLATDAAAEGLNLQARCRIVVHYELPWNPSRLEQRAGRVDRIGQHRRVHEMAFVAEDTAERLVLEPIARRAVQARRSQGGTRLLHVLGESRVAAAVMGEPLLLSPDAAGAGDISLHDFERQLPALTAEAHAEASRLARDRGWTAQSSAGGVSNDRPIISSLRSPSMCRSAAFVHDLSIRTADGARQHGEVVVVRVRTRLIQLPRSASALRLAVDRLRLALGKAVDVRVQQVADERLAEASITVAAAVERQRAREQEISAVAASAARRMVQAGLFDHSRPRTHTPALLNSSTPPLDSCTPQFLHSSIGFLHSSINLIAVMLMP